MEDRDDLSELLLNGLPPDEREHVINVIRQGDAEKLRSKRAEDTDTAARDGGLAGEAEEDDEFADAAD